MEIFRKQLAQALTDTGGHLTETNLVIQPCERVYGAMIYRRVEIKIVAEFCASCYENYLLRQN